MENQFLILAENITYKNNKLSCINIIDQFVVMNLPTEVYFDMVVICGPGWKAGNYDLSIKTQIDSVETDIGNINVEITSDNFIYNALAQNLKLPLSEDVNNVTFLVYRNDELLIKRNYQVSSLLVPVKQ